MLKIKEKMKKAVALATSMLFLFTTVFNGVSYANIKTDNAMEFNEQKEFLSPVLGKITSSKYYDSDEIVINIQDLHCHAQTQRQISSIIDLLEKKYQIKGVYLEGTYKDVNTSWLSGFNDGKNGSAIIEKMVDDGRLSGTEYYSLINNKKDFIKPIEDEQLYKENIRLLNEIIVNNQEVEIICNELEEQIKSIKKSYSGDKARKFDKLINDFKAKKIDSKKYYQELAKFAKEKNIDVTKYSNVALYIKLMENNASLNESKIGEELSRFLVEIKNKLPYQEYVSLVKKSNNFSKIENITNQLIKLNNQYQITKNLKLRNLESFISYLDFNDKINPVSFIEEEKSLKEEIFIKLGRTKYEQEVAFLNDFISNIREYFTANISAQEYYKFEREYKKFRTIWPSYFSVNTVKKLDKYQELLSKYHGNNIKRDYEFAKRIITKNNEKGSLIVKETKLAVEEIEKNIKNKKVKVVVTGGFHTRGLEKILEKNKISYAIITPKITGSIEKAKEIYWNTIIYNATILKNTINLEPLSQETLDISFPKVIASVFETIEQNLSGKYDNTNIKNEVESFINENVITKQDKSNADVEIENWEIESVSPDKTVYRVTYKDNSNKGTIIEKEYIYSHGETVPFSKIDLERTKSMAERTKSRKYAAPSVLLEPGNSARKKINKYILEPLKSVTDGFVSYMDYGQLHMTIGYDLSMLNLPAEEMDDIVRIASPEADIFVQTKNLGQENLKRTTLKGTLKLMPDGVIIYELKDTDLVEQMFNLRDKLTQNSKYTTPSIVHMTIGRITDTNLLDNSPESKQKLAELLRKINEKIYEINEANNLSKIKTRFNIKGGYVSSTGNQDFLVERILPKAEPLTILKKMIDSKSKAVKLALVTVIMPIAEEIVFRILPSLPLVITSFAITTNPILIIPAVITAITGTFVFAYAHALEDKLTNKEQIRNWKLLLPQSVLLTGVYLGILILFPEQILLAPVIAIVLHSLNNIISVVSNKVFGLTVVDNSNENKSSVPVIDQSVIDKTVEAFVDFPSSSYKEMGPIKEQLSNLPQNVDERYNIVVEQVFKLMEVLKKYTNYINKVRELSFGEELVPVLVPFVTLPNMNDSGRMLFYSMIDSLFSKERLAGRRYEVISELGSFMANVYSLNPDFVPYIIKKMLEEGLLKKDEKIPYSIETKLNKKGYDAVKQYYFALAAMDKLDENLSAVLTDTANKLNNDINPLITDEETKQSLNNISVAIEELSSKINSKSMPLLEQQLNSLIEEALKLKDTNRDLSFKIIKTVLSISKQILLENKDMNSRKIKIDKLSPMLIEEYDNNPDSAVFKDMIDQLIDICQPVSNDDHDSFNREIVEILTNAALHIYEPISSKQIEDVNSKEYQKIKKQSLDIFREMSLKRLDDPEIYDCLFNIKRVYRNRDRIGIGVTQETLDIFLNAVKKSGNVFKISLPNDDNFISDDVEQLADKIIDSIDNINPLSLILEAFGSQKYSYDKQQENIKTKQIATYIINKLCKIAEDNTADLEKRKRAVSVLFDVASEGIYKGTRKNISLDFDKVRELALELNRPAYLYPGNVCIRNIEGYSEYDFTPLMQFVPKNLFEEKPLVLVNYSRWDSDKSELLKLKKPVTTRISGKTDATKPEVQQVLFRFEVLQKILEYNTSVLALLDTLKDTKNFEKNMSELLNELQGMINELKKINSQHGADAQTALENIKLFLNDSTIDRKTLVRKNLVLSKWDETTIKDIKEIHTLINAIHQISISDFKQEIGDLSKVEEDKENVIQIIKSQQASVISGYNLSENVNPNVVKFIAKLASRKFTHDKIDDFVCKDDLVVWTTRLNAHSVDIFFNFGEADRGISVYYRERPVSHEDVGKKERVRYFKEILEYLGFHVDVDTQYSNGTESYGLKAVLNKDYGMNEAMDLIDIASHVVEVFKFSTNVDYDLRSRKRETQYEAIFEKWLRKAKRREAWYGVDINNMGWRAYGYGQGGLRLDSLPPKRSLDADALNNILSYLGCDLLPEDTTAEKLTDPNFLNKYFNKPIERAYIEGRIVLDKDSVLVRNDGVDIVRSMVYEVTNNIMETSIQSRIINFINSYDLKTRIFANIGGFVIVSSVMELTNGDKLFVKGIMNSKTKRMKYATTERVTSTSRQKLKSSELINLLRQEGYDIPKQEWIENRERQRIKNLLTRNIQTIESPNVPCTSTSEGKGVSVVGNITFNKDSVDENSIWIVPYTTPDDINLIEKAKGIITTGGGILSHAAITTREFKKPSVVFSGATWIDNNEIEILYYLSSGDTEVINKTFQVQKVKGKRMTLNEGSRVLMNGETGMVLLFDDIDMALLDELQQYINDDNAQAMLDFMNAHSDDTNINRFVEYVYFQIIGNVETEKTLDALFSENMPDAVRKKINELNDGYIQDKVQSISEAIDNIKSIKNVNIAYNIVEELNKKLSFIKTAEKRDDIEQLKIQIKEIEKNIKVKLNSYMQDFIDDLANLLAKDELDIRDIQRAILMVSNAEIYNYFINEFETSNELITKKETIEFILPMLKSKLNHYEIKDDSEDLKEEVSLFEANAGNEKKFGSKTAKLAKMYKLLRNKQNVTVPNGMVISVNIMPILFKSIGRENLLSEFESAIKNGDKQRATALSKTICNLIDSDEFTGTDIENEIKQRLSTFVKSGIKYSVRSSGVGEDSTNNAFAGMGETQLNVKENDIYENVKKCWKSFFADRCIDYMISSGQVVKPAVLVQEMIDSEISGVVFSRDKYGNGNINAVFGQGEGIVSGMFTPDNILFDMNSGEVIEYSVADKQFALVTDVNGGIKKVPVGQKAKSRTLNSQKVKQLAEVMKLLEDYAGYPIDVEFAVRGDELYILQMRPITTLDSKENAPSLDIDNIEKESQDAKCEIALTVGKAKDGQDVFVNIANPLNSEESIPVYFEMEKTADGYTYKYTVDPKYSSMIDIIRQILVVRSNQDSVIRDKINNYLSVFAQVKEGEIEILPPLSDTIDTSDIEQTINMNVDGIKNLLASA